MVDWSAEADTCQEECITGYEKAYTAVGMICRYTGSAAPTSSGANSFTSTITDNTASSIASSSSTGTGNAGEATISGADKTAKMNTAKSRASTSCNSLDIVDNCRNSFCYGCNSTLLKGENTNINMNNAGIAYTCDGYWWGDTTGSYFDSDCTSGWYKCVPNCAGKTCIVDDDGCGQPCLAGFGSVCTPQTSAQ
jgi:hypothetical protein